MKDSSELSNGTKDYASDKKASPGHDLASALLSDNAKYKRFLAEKILSGGRLATSEKEDIYRLITGKEPPAIRGKGRPSTVARDMAMAIDFLLMRYQHVPADLLLDRIRQYDERPLKLTNSAIYSAVDRGVSALLMMKAFDFVSDYDNGFLCDIEEENGRLETMANDLRTLHSLVGEYLEEKSSKTKTPKRTITK